MDGKGRPSPYTLADTAGCSGPQIVEAMHLGKGHLKHGISKGALRKWVRLHD